MKLSGSIKFTSSNLFRPQLIEKNNWGRGLMKRDLRGTIGN